MNATAKPVQGALLLAAGFSNRYGSIKLCAELESGKTVFAQTLENLQQALDNVIVVTRPELAEALIAHCDSLQIFDQAERGMGATLAYGIGLATDWDTCLVCLADMPFIQPETYRDIAAAQRDDQIVIPQYDLKPGNPVGFGREFYPELLTLSGDSGGRAVVQSHPDAVRRLPVADAAILYDIDTPADLARLQALAGPGNDRA